MHTPAFLGISLLAASCTFAGQAALAFSVGTLVEHGTTTAAAIERSPSERGPTAQGSIQQGSIQQDRSRRGPSAHYARLSEQELEHGNGRLDESLDMRQTPITPAALGRGATYHF